MVTIATFDDPAKAKHLKSRLAEAGLKADVHNERMQSVATGSDRHANAKVLVEEEDFQKANQLMHEWEPTDPEIGAAIRCPQCKSARIEYPQLTRKFMFPWLASIMFATKLFPKEFYCHDCHFTWGKDGDPLPKNREAWETFS